MLFYTAKEVNVTLNNNVILAKDLFISQDAEIEHPFEEGEKISERNVAKSPIKGELQLNYYLTGKDYLKDYLYANDKFPLTGNIAGLIFNQGYIKSYSLNGESNSPLIINVNIAILDEVSGTFTQNPSTQVPNDTPILNFNDTQLNTFNNYSAFAFNNVLNFRWNYDADIVPVYYYNQTGLSHINPDRVVIREKNIQTEITSYDTHFILPFTGQNFALELQFNHPSNTGIYEIYGCSGKISSKKLNIGDDKLCRTAYTITQSHLNAFPKISGVTTGTYPTNNYFLIDSINSSTNGFYTEYNKIPLIEYVVLGDDELVFKQDRYSVFDRITGYVSDKTINGTLQLKTSKGLIVYPTQVILDFPPPTISGFYPRTGNYGDLITITGENYNRITQVLFNGIRANFQSSNTGALLDSIIASVPQVATIGNIKVISELRNVSGTSTDLFYPIIEITDLIPATGQWGDNIGISGKNFSGITNVYFNNIQSPSFKVVNNNYITGQVPSTGAGYTKGYVKVSGVDGMSSISQRIYSPMVLITGLSALSGTIAEDFVIYTIFDSGFLYYITGTLNGFKIGFGDATGTFYRSGVSSNTLTGLIPTGYFDSEYVAIYEPDGVTKYPSYTGTFSQIGPAPFIVNIYPSTIVKYGSSSLPLNISVEGLYFKDFFGLSKYAAIFNDQDIYNFSTLASNSFQTKVIIPNVVITGDTGRYSLSLFNYAGTGTLTSGLLVQEAINLARQGVTYHFPEYVYKDDRIHPPGNAVDGGSSGSLTFSATAGMNTNRGALWQTTFSGPKTVSLIKTYQNNIPNPLSARFSAGGEVIYIQLITKGYIELYNSNNKQITGFSGVILSGFNSHNSSLGTGNVPGVKQLRIYSSGTPIEWDWDYGFLGFNLVEMF